MSSNVHNLAVEGHLRRLPGPGEGHCSPTQEFRDRRALVGGQQHQLGPGDGPARLLRHVSAVAPWAGPSGASGRLSRCPPGTSATSSPATCAQRMGVPDLPAGGRPPTRNDILTRFLTTGTMDHRGEVHPTLSPSMDIQVSSNARAAAVRGVRAHDGTLLHRRAAWPHFGPRGPSRSTTGDASVCWPRVTEVFDRRPGSTTTPPPAEIRRRSTMRTGEADRPPYRGGPGRRPGGAGADPRGAHGGACPPPTRPSSPMPSNRPSAPARSCRRTWPTCSTARSTASPPPPTSLPSRPSSAPRSVPDRFAGPG